MSVYYMTGWKDQDKHFAYMNSKDFNHNAHIPAPSRNFYSLPSEAKQFNGRVFVGKKKRTPRRTQLCVLVWILAFFFLLSVVMTSLFLWQLQVNRLSQGDARSTTQQTRQADNTAGCVGLPKPVELKTLPEQLNADLKTLEDLISNKIGRKNGFGALTANLVYREKVIWSGAFGVLNSSEKVPRKPTTSTLFPCASITKVITALSMYKLYDETLIKSLNEPITNFDPNFKIKNPFNNHELNLKDLASMRSGLQREAPCYPGNTENLCPYSHTTMINRIRNLSLLVEPNTMSQYSNLGYGVLGNVLAKRFAQGDFKALVDKYVLKPLKMDESKFSLQKSQVQDMPVAYDISGKQLPLLEWGWLNPTGGMFSSVNDLAKLEIKLMEDRNKDRYLSKAVTDELFSTMHILPDGKSMTGTPWEMNIKDGIVYRGKGGAIFGYNVVMIMVPEMRLAFNVMCTSCQYTLYDTITEGFQKLIVQTMKKELRKIYHEKIILPPDYRAYVGNYSTDDVPFLEKMAVEARDSRLVLLVNRGPLFYFNYTSDRRFRMSVVTEFNDCINSYTFASHNDLVVFDRISSRDGLSHGFVLFNAHPSGRSYFYRIPRRNQ